MITTSVSRVLVVPLTLLWSVRWRSHVSRSSSGSSSSTSNTSAANATHHREDLRWRCGNVRHRSMVDGRARSRFFLQCLVKPNAKIFGSHHRQLPRQASQDAQLCCFRVWPDRELGRRKEMERSQSSREGTGCVILAAVQMVVAGCSLAELVWWRGRE